MSNEKVEKKKVEKSMYDLDDGIDADFERMRKYGR